MRSDHPHEFPGEPDGIVAGDGHVEAGPIDLVRNGDKPMRPLQRLKLLRDEGSVRVIRSEVTSERMGHKAKPGDGVVGATADRRPAGLLLRPGRASRAARSARQHADTIVRLQRLAAAGARPSSASWSREARGCRRASTRSTASPGSSREGGVSGDVPQISVITGSSAGGGCYSPALTDFVVMTQAHMFLTGPAVVREVTGEDTTAEELGGPRVHSATASAITVETDVDAVFLVRQLLSYLPQSAGAPLPLAAA